MDYFNIEKETPLVIYGLGDIGKQKCRALVDAGYQVISIIDREAEKIQSFCNISVLTIESFCQEFHNRKEIFIIVCLNNGMQHEVVARNLYIHGYDRILYIPMDEKNDYSYFAEMQHAYSVFLDGMFTSLDKIPVYCNKHNNTGEEMQVLSTDLENVTFLCEIEYLFSPDEKMIREAAASEDILRNALENPEYIDCPIVMCKNYSNLYDYIMGVVSYPDLYMRYFGKDKKYNQMLLEDRLNLFDCYEQRHTANMQLFYLQPATAEWNPKGYFNIRDGMHRAIFLFYVKKHLKIPIKTKKTSFKEFCFHYKKQAYIYKSKQLILQEHISEYFDIHKSRGVVLDGCGDSLTIECLKWMSKDVVSLKGIEECLNFKDRFDYIYMYSFQLASFIAKTPKEIFCIAPRILIECSEDSMAMKNFLSNGKVAEIGSVLGKDFKRTYFYLLEREENE